MIKNEETGLSSAKRKQLSKKRPQRVLMRLFIAGLTPRSQATLEILRDVCEEWMMGCYQLEVIDICQQPELARVHQIVATPTLVKYQPHPQKIMIGDLSRKDRVLSCLGFKAG